MKVISGKQKDSLSSIGKASDCLMAQLLHWKNKRTFDALRLSQQEYSLKGFDELKCIYVHIPKSAGVSVNRALFGNLGGGHRSVRQYKRIFGPTTFKNYFKFTFVRNPYSRLLSAYRFLKNGGMNDADKKWSQSNLNEVSSFAEFVHDWFTEESVFSRVHFRPQHAFICDGSLAPSVDFIGQFETIEDDFAYVCERLKISRTLKKANRGPHIVKHWSTYYSATAYDKIFQIYRKDFELFGYDAGPT